MSVVALREAAPDVVGAPRKYELMEPFLVPVKDLVVPTYQRETDEAWCQKTAGEFDPNLFLPIVVERTEGKKWAVNQGCHRKRIAEIVGLREVWACPAKTDNPGELFVAAQQKQRDLTPFQQHFALRDDRSAQALRIDALLRGYGLKMDGSNKKRGSVNSVAMFYRLVFGKDAKIGQIRRSAKPHVAELEAALKTITEAWSAEHRDAKSRSGKMIEAIVQIHFFFGDQVDKRRLREVLTAYEPWTLNQRAKNKRALNKRGDHASVLAGEILVDYNDRRRRADQLDATILERLW